MIQVYNMARGSGGLQKLREDLEVENEGVRVPAAARWLCEAATRTRYNECRPTRSSMMLAVAGKVAASRLSQKEARLSGVRHEVEAFVEARPDAFCRRYCAWGHIAPPLHGGESEVRLLSRGTPVVGSPVPGRGMPGREEPHVRTRGGQM